MHELAQHQTLSYLLTEGDRWRLRDASGAEHSIYFCSAASIVEETDAEGRVTLPYFSPGDRAALKAS